MTIQKPGLDRGSSDVTHMMEPFCFRKSATFRTDVICVLVLSILAGLIWCFVYNRWTVDSWETPLSYVTGREKGDAMWALAGFKAAKDGDIWPVQFTNIPELGAPYVANWDDYPSTEKLLASLPGVLARFIGIFAAANFTIMAGSILAAFSFFVACRLLDCSRVWSFAGALVFAFAHFGFAHGLHHYTIGYFWHVPLGLVVCRWVVKGQGINFRERRFIFALIVALITGIQNVYYTNMFAQFVLFGGLVQWRRNGWRAALPATTIIGVAAAGFLFMDLSTFFYHHTYGPNTGVVVRAYKWLEIFALKIVDVVIPPPDHHLSLFARFGAWHMANAVLPPGELPPAGYIGLSGLAALLWLTVVSLRKLADDSKLPLETWQILWILLYAGVGGINGVIGSFGFLLFRATARYVIFILAIVLMYAVGRLSRVQFKGAFTPCLAAFLIVLIALWDQTPPQVTFEEMESTARVIASDRAFVTKMETQFSDHAMVFQFPVMEFPESSVPGMNPYDHFRPYLYSSHLRFSFGSDKGRSREKWQLDIARSSPKEAAAQLEKYGFSGIYVNRSGFGDNAESFVQALRAAGYNQVIESADRDLLCVVLKPSSTPVLP